MRIRGLAVFGLGLILAGGVAGSSGALSPTLAFQGTPAASPAVAIVTATPAPAVAPTHTPTPAPAIAVIEQGATPAAAATVAPPATKSDVETLVAWYVTDPSGEFINLYPLGVAADHIASEQTGAATIGTADFPDNDAPVVKLGETTFTAYPRTEWDIPERWTWFDDTEGSRPATLVMQASGAGGAYNGYHGTVTFVSRDDTGTGGVLILAIRPPQAETANTPAEAEGGASEPATIVTETPAETQSGEQDTTATQ